MTDDDKALVERLRAGVPCCDPDAGNGEGSFFVEDADETMHEAADRIEALSAENERLREAMEFYANNKNYRYIIGADCTSVDIDAGDTARAALGDTK